MKEVKVLGLDLGTNSVGHALVTKKYEEDSVMPASIEIIDANSRIVPPRSAAKDPLVDYLKGAKQKSTASERRGFRSMRRRYGRFILRRERLFRVLHELAWLPEHMENALDFEKHLGRFKVQNDKSLKVEPTDKTVQAPTMQWDGKEFAFPQAFDAMLADFAVPAGTLISHDWVIYYLRNKALVEKLSNEELAYVISAFNAKRGYYQRGRNNEDKTEDANKLTYTIEPTIVEKREIIDDDELPKGIKNKNMLLVLDCQSRLKDARGNAKPLCFYFDKFKDRAFSAMNVGDKIANVIVEEIIEEDDDGNDILKSQPKCFIDAWLYKKTRAAESLASSGKTLGATIYDMLKETVASGDIRIVGGVFGTINRKHYVDELRKILEVQAQWHPELKDAGTLKKVAAALYPKNPDHQAKRTGKNQTLIDFIIEDVVFYQRPLKTKKSLIDKCELESRGNNKRPCAAISNPIAQEFRVLQFVSNLKVLDEYGEDWTALFLGTPEKYQVLYELLISKKEQKFGESFNKELIKIATGDSKKKSLVADNVELTAQKIKTNFDEVKSVKLNYTREEIAKRFKKLFGSWQWSLSAEQEYALWHLCYSVSDPIELEKGLKKFATKYAEIFAGTQISPEKFAEEFVKIEPFEEGYSAYSEKALKKMLPLMRPKFVWESVPASAQTRIDAFLNYRSENADEDAREEHEDLRDYLVKQGRVAITARSEFYGLQPWLAKLLVYGPATADDGEKWVCGNDIRKFISNSDKKGFRAGTLRNPIVEAIALESLRVVADIVDKYGVPDEIHIELGRELNATAEQRKKTKERNDKNEAARKNAEERCKEYIRDTHSNEKLAKLVDRYLLWEEQEHRDPYVLDRTISLSEALNGELYQVDHIVPYSKYNNDSRDNKVLTIAVVNKEKTNRTGMQFIKETNGASVGGNAIYSVAEYRNNVHKFFRRNKRKQELLLSETIPEGFQSAQLNNTRYITKFVAKQLSKLVRGNDKDGGAISKNIVVVSGGITDRLKNDWGLGNAASGVWNQLMRERVRNVYGNAIRQEDGSFSNGVDDDGKCRIDEDAHDKTGKGGLKRIDHRHHALDAIVIASCDRRHVQNINRENAQEFFKQGENQKREFAPPCKNFAEIVKDALANKVVSIKGNNRVFTGNTSYIATYQGRKKKYEHKKQSGFVIRRRLHEDTFWGLIDENKVSLRINLEVLGNAKTAADKKSVLKKINNCNDNVVKFILNRHLLNNGSDLAEAFSPNGIAEMNAIITRDGNALTPKGKAHKAIKYLHIVEDKGAGFIVSKTKYKPTKVAYGAKGGNLKLAVFLDNKGKWGRKTIVIRDMMSSFEIKIPNLLFEVRPDDLLYWPEEAKQNEIPTLETIDLKRVFKVRKFGGPASQLFVDPVNISTPLLKDEVLIEIARAQKFYPLTSDRLGNITGIKTDFSNNG